MLLPIADLILIYPINNPCKKRGREVFIKEKRRIKLCSLVKHHNLLPSGFLNYKETYIFSSRNLKINYFEKIHYEKTYKPCEQYPLKNADGLLKQKVNPLCLIKL